MARRADFTASQTELGEGSPFESYEDRWPGNKIFIFLILLDLELMQVQ